MPRLVALDLAGGPTFVTALRRCLDDGDAAWPVDQRLPKPQREALFALLAPGAYVGGDGRVEPLPGGRPTEEGDALVVATSGTTGHPRGVVLSLDAVRASAAATSERLGVDPASDRWLCCLPVAHIGGLALVLRALLTGTALEVHPGFDTAAVLDALDRGATLVSLVPTALYRLGEESKRFRTVVLGGSAPPDTLADNVVTTYGLTESGSGVVYDGRPLRDVEVRVADTGEISLRAPMLGRVYRDGTALRDADGWFATGDAGALREDGRLAVDGRIAEVIVTGGEKVWPAPVEAVLSGLPGVREVAVCGVPDDEWGARVVAFLVCEAGVRPSLEECREAVRAELAPWASPKQLVFVDELPRTSIGKVRRQELVARAAQ